ncbi:MAG: 6-phosphofructokinase, partial [Propionibacteriaceae bacterium]|nr:6-phosphofructokinase [Propionibacteriaceae bacterium]
LLANRLGAAAADLIDQGTFGVLVAARGEEAVPVPLDQVAGRIKQVPPDHEWVRTARSVGTGLGD